MAMYEDRGFCPSNGFIQEEMRSNTSYFWERTKELLGDRIGYMVYDEEPKGNEHGYFVDALTHAIGTLGIEIATTLKVLIPECRYAETGCPIVLQDIDGIPPIINSNGHNFILMNIDGPSPFWCPVNFEFEDGRYKVFFGFEGMEIYVTTCKK